MTDKKKFLSKEGYEKLINERQELKQIKLPAVLEALAEAKEMGDLSENFDYKSALEERDLINSRLKQIEELLEDVEIVEGEAKKWDKTVGFGSKVKIQIEDDKPYEVTIVGSWEVSIKEKELLISFESPLGQAIRGKKAGETVKMKIDNNRRNVKILEIK